MLSPEDIAWADSCFAKDTDTLENGWDSLKDALFDTLSAQSQSSLPEKDISYEEVMMRFSPSEETVRPQYFDESTPGSSDAVSSKREKSDSKNDGSKGEKADDFWSSHKVSDVFLPTYNEDLKDLCLSDPEMDFVFQAFETEQTTTDIFKIWDLNVLPEEDDLAKRLNKAFDENSLGPTSSASDNAEVMKELKDMTVDDLVSGIADLSIHPS